MTARYFGEIVTNECESNGRQPMWMVSMIRELRE
jgi:hypothetical protein